MAKPKNGPTHVAMQESAVGLHNDCADPTALRALVAKLRAAIKEEREFFPSLPIGIDRQSFISGRNTALMAIEALLEASGPAVCDVAGEASLALLALRLYIIGEIEEPMQAEMLKYVNLALPAGAIEEWHKRVAEQSEISRREIEAGNYMTLDELRASLVHPPCECGHPKCIRNQPASDTEATGKIKLSGTRTHGIQI